MIVSVLAESCMLPGLTVDSDLRPCLCELSTYTCCRLRGVSNLKGLVGHYSVYHRMHMGYTYHACHLKSYLLILSGVTRGPVGKHQWDVSVAELLSNDFLIV